MPETQLAYRIWQCGLEWRWRVILEGNGALVAGVAETSVAARTAAMLYCLKHSDDQPEQ
jgi:hypothetical protein